MRVQGLKFGISVRRVKRLGFEVFLFWVLDFGDFGLGFLVLSFG